MASIPDYRAVRDTFRIIDPLITDDTFLEVFQNSGCYLIDACARQIDHLECADASRSLSCSERSLTRKSGGLSPPSS
jgi:hypothetical protein